MEELTKKIEVFFQKFTSLEQRVSKLETWEQEMVTITNLKSEIVDLGSKHAELVANLDTVKQVQDRLTATVSTIQDEQIRLSNTIVRVNETVEKISLASKRIDDSMNIIRSEQDRLSNTINTLNETISRLAEESQRISSTIKTVTSEQLRLNDTITALNNVVTRVKQEADRLSNIITTIKDNVTVEIEEFQANAKIISEDAKKIAVTSAKANEEAELAKKESDRFLTHPDIFHIGDIAWAAVHTVKFAEHMIVLNDQVTEAYNHLSTYFTRLTQRVKLPE